MTKYEIHLDVEADVEWGQEPDDDGCGDPSVTGNGMTGSRGMRDVVRHVEIDWKESERIVDAIRDQIIEQAEPEL